ncbi:uncharacterized protein BX664DRAFT_330253, partial [Halteromyces radiatus]|uniref:uncharacterized protein n=1 Tax=Halteromyces radiatus TaxID=101107 RepID=UPI0022201D14
DGLFNFFFLAYFHPIIIMVLKSSIVLALFVCAVSGVLTKKQPDDKGKMVARQLVGSVTGGVSGELDGVDNMVHNVVVDTAD